jgi:hypothetical protein
MRCTGFACRAVSEWNMLHRGLVITAVIQLKRMPSRRVPLPKRIYTRANASARFWADNLDPLMILQALLVPPDT